MPLIAGRGDRVPHPLLRAHLQRQDAQLQQQGAAQQPPPEGEPAEQCQAVEAQEPRHLHAHQAALAGGGQVSTLCDVCKLIEIV